LHIIFVLEDSQPHLFLWAELWHLTGRAKTMPEPQLLLFG